MPHDLSRMRGIIPPLVTPLAGADELDCEGLARLIERVLKAPVAGLFILGTTGEGPNLSHRLRRELIDETTKLVNGRVPVLVGITDTSIADSAALADYAADRGIDGVVVAPPFYHKPTSAELRRWIATLAPRLPLPFYPYNMPAHTRTVFDLGTLEYALSLPNCPGYKDSGGDLDAIKEVIALRDRLRPDWRIYVGPEHLTAAVTDLGGDGGVNGGANVHPFLFTDLFKARGKERDALQTRLEAFGRIYRLATGESAVIRGLKAALAAEGVCSNRCAEPWEALPVDEQVREIVRSA